jgi:hypothetical protein
MEEGKKESNSNTLENNSLPKKSVGIETYIEDMNRIISDNKDGLLKKVLTEQEKFENRKYMGSPQVKKNKKLMFISLFLAVSAVIILILFLVFKKEVTSVDVNVVYEPFIFTDTTQFKEISGLKKDEISKIIREEAGGIKIKPGEIEGIYFTENKNVIGLRKFLQYIGGSLLPGDELFINDNFLLGLSNRGTNDFFMILKIRSSSFLDVFKAMQAWEDKLFYDLHGFFGIDSNVGTDYLNDKEFEDSIVDNKNSRVLYDKDGNIVLMYVFVDTNYVVITNTVGSADEIIRRLTPGEIKK